MVPKEGTGCTRLLWTQTASTHDHRATGNLITSNPDIHGERQKERKRVMEKGGSDERKQRRDSPALYPRRRALWPLPCHCAGISMRSDKDPCAERRRRWHLGPT